ncbi:hypothetical protein Tco_0323314 [Tanacetum coccineum]
MQRLPLLEADGFFLWKTFFETYNKSKYIDLWQVIQNGDFYFKIEDSKSKMVKETSYDLLKDDQKKNLVKNNEAKITLYNALPRKEYEIVFMCKTTKEVGHALIITHQDPDYSSKNHMRKFLCTLPLKWRAKVKTIEKAKNLATLPLGELLGNLKVSKMVMDNDGVGSKTIDEKVKSLALKAKVTREQTSDDSDKTKPRSSI